MSPLPRVLISILNYNNTNDVIETVECFYQQEYPSFDIQVIDNGSTNGCVDILNKRFPNLKVIALNNNVGYAGGNNIAFDIGLEDKYNYVLISNNDVAVNKDLVSDLVSTAMNYPELGLLGLIEKDYYSGETRVIGGFGFKPYLGKGTWERSIRENNNKVLEVDYVQGALVLFTRKALLSGIRFDEKLFLYCEEVDIQFPIRENGFKALVDLNCIVRHKGVQKLYNPLQGYYIQRNRIYLSKKYAKRFQYYLAIIFIGLIELPIKFAIRGFQGNAYYAYCCILGFMDGVNSKMGKGRGLDL